MKQLEPPNIRYEHVFVILQDGKTRQYDNATVYLLDNQLSDVAKEGKRSSISTTSLECNATIVRICNGVMLHCNALHKNKSILIL